MPSPDADLCFIARLLDRLGGHLSHKLEIDLSAEDDRSLESWLIVACLCSARMDEEKIEHIFRALRAAHCSNLQEITSCNITDITQTLARADCKNPEREAAKFKRAANALDLHYRGSLSRLAREAEGIEDLVGRIAALAPGIGVATALQFLRPLRDTWRLADEIPLHAATRAAAIHLQLLRKDEDAEGAPSILRAKLYAANEVNAQTITFADFEAALLRLGERACTRKKVANCPMQEVCPVHSSCKTK